MKMAWPGFPFTISEKLSISLAKVARAAFFLSLSVHALFCFAENGIEDVSVSTKGVVIFSSFDGTSGILGASGRNAGEGSVPTTVQSGKLKFFSCCHIGDREGSLNVLKQVSVMNDTLSVTTWCTYFV
jgi:hypothetical protein